ncbi:ephrin type-B receptor 1-B-like isoform X4 [Ostrea edulis]|uniref:ephrin type-B receptor 1-B-like isoform X4 n=1 Tax=Ostrea edulis TaxID=37623 RepID=UPI0024AFFDE0|nr:ephrin type-B receptor 1-B-like isoform X4 [Ostrea edulis]
MARRRTVFSVAPYFIVLICFSTVGICSREVVLLDSSKFPNLKNWTTHINGQSDSNTGWKEGSFMDSGKIIRIFSSCSVSSSDVDNWLRTPYIPRRGANSLRIEIRFSMRRCVRHSDPTTIKQCKETFNLYYYEADTDIANAHMPTWDSVSYSHIDKIAADNLYDSNTDILLNTEVRDISLTPGMGGVYIAFQDRGACVTLISIKVSYVMCPNVTINYAFFQETPVGRVNPGFEEHFGKCVPNAAEKTRPKYLCQSDGVWTYPTGGCQCLSGYEGQGGTACVECRPGFFKWLLGNTPCSTCPPNSYTNLPRSVECSCADGYYRNPRDSKNSSCTQPPSKPRNLVAEEITHNSITLSWISPVSDGGRKDVQYRVACNPCESVSFHPGWENINRTRVSITGLTSSTKYSIRVSAVNGVSNISNIPVEFEEGQYTTKASTQTILNFQISSRSQTEITITWDIVSSVRNQVMFYQVRSAPRLGYGDVLLKNISANHQNYTFKNLNLGSEYSLQVRCYLVEKGWGDFTQPINVIPGEPIGKEEIDPPQKMSVGIIIAAALAVVVCMVIATGMIVILIKRNQRECQNDKGGGEYDPPYNPVLHCPQLEPHMNGGLTMPLFPPADCVKSYVDPHTYEDPNQAVREFTREIDASHITIESVIGGGEFGDVCKGKLRNPVKPEMSVAIKTLKPGATDKNRLDFLTEASIMGQFDDQNVIFLEGVVTKSHPIMIVTEYMENGSLDTFLRNNDGKFTIIQLVGMMRGIASGMRYLSNMGYIHRDLAARNILINGNLVCKVADFGLSREIDIDTTDGAYTTKGGKIPVRWTAPEAIAFRKFTSASDVWSYGVVMWEVVSYGERPYWNWSNQDVIRAVDRGYRLPPPMDCPEAIHQLMLDCWQKERGNRPKFDIIVKSLDKFIRAPEMLRKIAKPRPEFLMDTNRTLPMNRQGEVSNFTNVEGWLISIKMEKYIDNFLNCGYRTMDQVLKITQHELEQRVGVTLIGHQKKIMNSIQTLRTQRFGQFHQVSEGFLV